MGRSVEFRTLRPIHPGARGELKIYGKRGRGAYKGDSAALISPHKKVLSVR